MSKRNIDNLIQTALIKAVAPLLSRQSDNGLFKQTNPESSTAYDAQAIYPFSYLYQTKFKGNTYYKEPRLLESLVKIGDYCAKHTNANGLMYYYSHGNTGYSLDQRFLIFWLDAFVLIEKELNQKTKNNWLAAMKRSLSHLENKLSGYNTQEVFNSYSFGTSPNHASLYACALFIGGVVLKNKQWQKIAEKFMDTFVAFQRDEGYWPEGHGPVGVYCSVSLAGVSRMSQMLNGRYKEAIFKSLEYFRKISYPNFSFVELTDKRNHYHQGGFTWGFHGFTETLEGQSFACNAIEASMILCHNFGGEFCARLLENLVYMKKMSRENYKHWSGTRFLGNHSAFIRKNSWQINYSVNPVVVHPHSPFRLDYGKVYSVWHNTVGLIIDGSQSKKNDEHNTFYNKNGESFGVLYGGRLHTNAKEPFVEALYSSNTNLLVKTKFVNAKEILISGENSKADEVIKGLRFNVPLYLHLGDEINVGTKKIILSAKKIAMRIKKGTMLKLHAGKVLLTLHCDGILHFPEYLFNPYAKDNTSSIEAAYLRLELIPIGKPQKAQLSVKVF